MKFLQLFCFGLTLTSALVACDGDEKTTPSDAGSDAARTDEIAQRGLRPEQINGTYLYAISIVLSPHLPATYLAEIEAEDVDGHIEVRLRQRPLSKRDRATPVGPWSDWSTAAIDADGALTSDPVKALIPAAGNPITGVDTEAEIVMIGQLEELRDAEYPDAPFDFLCGDVNGRIIGPIAVDDLSGSTFAATRVPDVDDPNSYPDVVINCAKDPARSLN